jgi:hypothetical protein
MLSSPEGSKYNSLRLLKILSKHQYDSGGRAGTVWIAPSMELLDKLTYIASGIVRIHTSSNINVGVVPLAPFLHLAFHARIS